MVLAGATGWRRIVAGGAMQAEVAEVAEAAEAAETFCC